MAGVPSFFLESHLSVDKGPKDFSPDRLCVNFPESLPRAWHCSLPSFCGQPVLRWLLSMCAHSPEMGLVGEIRSDSALGPKLGH